MPAILPPTNIDLKMITWINQFHSPFFDKIMVLIANIGEYAIIWFVIGIIIFLTNKRQGKKIFLVLIFSLIIEVIINDGFLKQYFFRERPYLLLPNIHQAGPNWINSSFVSGHTASTIAAITVIGYFYRRWLTWLIPLGLIMVYTRLYLGMHYPTDILGGIVVGLLSGVIALQIGKKILKLKT
jgi:undecaprenyl-diphosphatase